MQLLQAVESISRQRSVETVECALLQTLGENFGEISAAVLLAQHDDDWWISADWHDGQLQKITGEAPAPEALKLLADITLNDGEGSLGGYRAYRLEYQEPALVLVIRSTELDEAALRALSSLIKIVENFSRLLREKNRDRLTGLLNRHQLEESIIRALNLAEDAPHDEHRRRRERHPDWLAILDIDHFKRINDTYGHLFGDEVLLLVSQLMVSSFRREDLLFRYGGEEFVLLLSDLPEDQALLVIERFRERVARHAFPQIGQVTLSIGFTRVGNQGSASSVLGEADRALYWTKQNGRNRSADFATLVSRGDLCLQDADGSIDLF